MPYNPYLAEENHQSEPMRGDGAQLRLGKDGEENSSPDEIEEIPDKEVDEEPVQNHEMQLQENVDD